MTDLTPYLRSYGTRMHQICNSYAFKFHTDREELWSLGLERMWLHFPGEREGNTFLGYWNRVLRNLCIDQTRRNKRIPPQDDIELAYAISSSDRIDPDVRRELAQTIMYARRRFGPIMARMLWMKGLGWKDPDLAQEFGLPFGTVKSILYRMRTDLQEWRAAGRPVDQIRRICRRRDQAGTFAGERTARA